MKMILVNKLSIECNANICQIVLDFSPQFFFILLENDKNKSGVEENTRLGVERTDKVALTHANNC